MSTEERLASAAATVGGPQLDRDLAAEALGSSATTLDAQLRARAQESRESLPTGLRLDQAAALHHVLTSPRIAEVLVGPAGSASRLWPRSARSSGPTDRRAGHRGHSKPGLPERPDGHGHGGLQLR